jgi:hypothetical protein
MTGVIFGEIIAEVLSSISTLKQCSGCHEFKDQNEIETEHGHLSTN